MKYYDKIKEKRLKLELTQLQAAELLEISLRAYRYIELGYTMPRPKSIQAIEKHFGIKLKLVG